MIRVADLVHRYGDTAAVDGLDLTIDNGECVILAGANGSGKTTLVRHFNGLLEPDEGTVHVNDSDVSENLVAARTAVSMVFQRPEDQLVAATIGADVAFGPENLGLDRDEIDRRVHDALAAVNLDGREKERVDALSGGEIERLAIAGALAMQPDHLVLDEPFTGLDEPARQSVLSRLRDLRASGTSLIVVTHDLRDVSELADRVVVLSDGQVALDGAPEAVADDLPDLDVRPPC
ncbi:cobalt ABC transporter ATP-binding protein [Haloferax elongans ATCC BAA-1513]|uniref:Cobalt ABC transporter ATP-binding protein n=1 Tax=Haloferax elongans ATCC BAA-1513 TaxID=1230453 RepID=M0HUC7_HALEO|nr:ABC transporter ATP-binding protein [Haloferax elongans]ELZ87353.1 cobalt ABC transporter ATP-binding protein [Haloferax elongans ATCC BAA-1513]